MTEVRALALKVFGKTNGSSVYELLRTDWNRYGLDLVKGDTLAQKLVVPLVEKNGAKLIFPVGLEKMEKTAIFFPPYN